MVTNAHLSSGSVVFSVGKWRLGDDGHIYRRGKLKYSNCDLYDGEWVNGKRHGEGTILFANGGSYAGQFKNDFYDGFGILTVYHKISPWMQLTTAKPPKDYYEGEFIKGSFHGHGTYYSEKKGMKYNGDFVLGYYDGKGTCAYANGDVYEGEWKHGRWNGEGRHTRADGSTYKGEFLADRYHGYGKLYYGPGGKLGSYIGHFKHGKKIGHGLRVFADKVSQYEGAFVDDQFHGYGVLKIPAYSLSGFFDRGSIYGEGTKKFANGSHYQGEFNNGHYHGRGTFTYSDGSYYSGDFVSSQKHGKGKQVFSSGDVYEGDWESDLMHGVGELTKTIESVAGKGLFKYCGCFCQGKMQDTNAKVTYQFLPTCFKIPHKYTEAFEFPVGSTLFHLGSGKVVYKGGISSGYFHGSGTMTSPDGKMRSGEWVDGKLQGNCLIVRLPLQYEILQQLEAKFGNKNSENRRQQYIKICGRWEEVSFYGEIVQNKRHGRGSMTLENGDTISGYFHNSFLEGEATYKFGISGKIRSAWYERGKRLHWIDKVDNQNVDRNAEPEVGADK